MFNSLKKLFGAKPEQSFEEYEADRRKGYSDAMDIVEMLKNEHGASEQEAFDKLESILIEKKGSIEKPKEYKDGWHNGFYAYWNASNDR